MRPRLVAHRLPAVAALLLAIGCGAETTVAPSPVPQGSVTITMDSSTVYAGDVVPLRAVVRDAAGHDIPGAPLMWSASDTTIATVGASGVVVALRTGATRISARSGEITATLDIDIRRLSVLSVEILGLPDTMDHGDVIPFGVRITGEGGRMVTGRAVTLATADAGVAVIDPSGRLRTITAGRTDVIASVDGAAGKRAVVVGAGPVVLPLRDIDGGRLPKLVAVDTVEWNGERELAEVYAETGSLQLSGGRTPRYAMVIHYAQYAVTRLPDGGRRLELRARFAESDFGVVQYDALGELEMTSEYTAPLSHTASASVAGIAMRYRIPGDDTILSLFFRREPK